MLKPIILSALAAATVFGANAADPSLRIYSGVRDTLYSPKTVLVAVTDPGAKATVNGNAVHVYKTGSFGTELQLQPGANRFEVAVTNNSGTTVKELNIFRAEPKAKAPQAKALYPEDATFMYGTTHYVVTKPGAYLQYGNGDDRLGGSKMGFIDSGIRLAVIGEKGSLYCVRLGTDRLAYLPKSYAEPTDSGNPVVNTGSWSLTNTGTHDRVSVALPCRLAYQYTTDLDPNTLTIDLFGATDNSNWITQRTLSLGIIDYVDFRQVSDDVYRVIIRLKDKYNWGFEVYYPEGSNSLTIDVKHRPASLKLKDLVIGLDAGHGGEYPGAISPSGIKEKDVNLDIVHRLNDLLKKRGATTVLTRDGDTGPSMTERKRIWAAGKIDVAISVHNNAGGSALDSPGTATLYKHLFCRPLAIFMAERMTQTGLPLFGVVGNFNFSLNGPTAYPNVLIEGMFMSSLREEEKLADPAFRQQVAEKILAALEDYLASAAR